MCLQQVKNFKYLVCEHFYKIEKDILQTLENFLKGILNSTFKLNLVQKFSRIKVVYITHCLFHFFYMEVKRGHLEKIIKRVDIS